MVRLSNFKFIHLIAVIYLFILPVYSQVETPKWTLDKVQEEDAYTIGTQAYLYYVAPFMMYSVLYQSQRVPYFEYKDGMPFNTWTKVSDLGNPQNTKQVMPNVNTLYASSWLDLRKEPIVLEIPRVGDRYYSVAMMDAYMNNFRILGSRTVGPYGGKFLICSEDYNGIIPNDMQKVIAPTPMIWVLQRIAPIFTNAIEVDECKKIQNAINITPLSQYGKNEYDMMRYNEKLDLGFPDISNDPLKFFEIANEFVHINRPPEVDKGVLSLFARLNLGPDYKFRAEDLTPAQRTGLLRGMEAGKELINTYLLKGDNTFNGWMLPVKDGGNYGTNYLLRAAYTMQNIGILSPDEALYLTSYVDVDGNEYDGKNNYILHFEKDKLPRVDAFWSITLYELPSILLYENSIKRYQMGPQIEQMVYNSDGSLDIYIQHDSPKDKNKIGNWLPSPKGKFALTMRLYNPKVDMLTIGKGYTEIPGLKIIK